MPQFRPELSQPDLSGASFVTPAARPSGATETLVTGIKALGEMAIEQQDRDTKSEFSESMEEISAQETIFKEKQTELTSDLLSEKDKARINTIHQDLLRLEKGEVTGALSRQAADVRRKAILRQGIQENPWLTSELSALQSAFRTTGAVKDSPEKKALDALREEATMAGRDLATQIGISNFIADKDLTVAKKEQSLAAGTLNFPEFRNAFNSQLELERTSMFDQIIKSTQADPTSIDATDWGGFVHQTEARFRRLAQQEEAKAAQKGIILSDTERSRIEKDLDSAMSGIKLFAESKDKLKYLERQEKAIKLHGMDILSKSNPFLAFLISTGMGELAQKFAFDILPATRKEMAKHGNIDRISLAAENGETDSILFMQALDFNSQYEQAFHNKIKVGFDGTEGDLQKAIVRQTAGKWLSMPTDPTEGSAELESIRDSSVERLTEEEAPVQELQWFTKPAVKKNMTPSRVKLLTNKIDLMEAALTTELQTFGVAEEDTRTPTGRGLPPVVRRGRELEFNPTTGFSFKGEVRAARTPEPKILKDLNLLYKLRKMYGGVETSTTEWANSLIKGPEAKEDVVDTPEPTKKELTVDDKGIEGEVSTDIFGNKYITIDGLLHRIEQPKEEE